MSKFTLMVALAFAVTTTTLVSWQFGLVWGVVAYVVSGALMLLLLGVIRALQYSDESHSKETDGGLLTDLLVSGSAQNYGSRPAQRLQVRRKRYLFIVLGVIFGARGKRRPVPLRYLPQTSYTGAEKEVVRPRVH